MNGNTRRVSLTIGSVAVVAAAASTATSSTGTVVFSTVDIITQMCASERKTKTSQREENFDV